MKKRAFVLDLKPHPPYHHPIASGKTSKRKKMNQIIDKHNFMLGENLRVETLFFDNGDSENFVYMNQKLVVQGHVDDASLNLCGSTFGPEKLRELANELESALIKANNSKKTATVEMEYNQHYVTRCRKKVPCSLVGLGMSGVYHEGEFVTREGQPTQDLQVAHVYQHGACENQFPWDTGIINEFFEAMPVTRHIRTTQD